MNAPSTKELAAVTVRCAFCGGAGQDPFGVMSPLSTCQVCGGQGKRFVRPPTAGCPFCGGTGVHPHSRMTCTVCGGVGTISVPEHAVDCGCCSGSGRAADSLWPDSPLPCSCCGGRGVVSGSQRARGGAPRSKHGE